MAADPRVTAGPSAVGYMLANLVDPSQSSADAVVDDFPDDTRLGACRLWLEIVNTRSRPISALAFWKIWATASMVWAGTEAISGGYAVSASLIAIVAASAGGSNRPTPHPRTGGTSGGPSQVASRVPLSTGTPCNVSAARGGGARLNCDRRQRSLPGLGRVRCAFCLIAACASCAWAAGSSRAASARVVEHDSHSRRLRGLPGQFRCASARSPSTPRLLT